MAEPVRLAFYDWDGTLVSSNVVTQYAWYARHAPSLREAAVRTARVAIQIPLLAALELYSRTRLNIVFYREYRGLRRAWLEEMAEGLFAAVFRPSIYPGARALVESDKSQGYRTVLVTGSLDFALGPVMRHFRFDHLIANSLVFEDGVATGEIAPPLIAEAEKVAAMRKLSRECDADLGRSKAYSDSMSDLPMLEAVGLPAVVHPGRRLKRIARRRGWPILDLRKNKPWKQQWEKP